MHSRKHKLKVHWDNHNQRFMIAIVCMVFILLILAVAIPAL
ncbi:hypothetical protein VDG1235_3511 [Verrucomicrobiia bacterium DG1235]|nr:hypothetical protein VDG1235_3511 [Verrucomicrobiae bacterium DG1235]